MGYIKTKFRKKSEIIMCAKLLVEENSDKNILANKYVISKLSKYCKDVQFCEKKISIDKTKDTIRLVVIDRVVNYKSLCEILNRVCKDKILTYIVTTEKNRSGLDRTLRGLEV